VSQPQDALADAWHRLADECVKAVRVNHQLIDQLSRAGLLPSPTATALTASTDQLEAKAAVLRRRHPPHHGSSIRQSDW
jgi:hypothetical protein